MRAKKSVYVDDDVRAFLKEESFFSDDSQTDILNRAIRLLAFATNRERILENFDAETVRILSQVLDSDCLTFPIPARAKRT